MCVCSGVLAKKVGASRLTWVCERAARGSPPSSGRPSTAALCALSGALWLPPDSATVTFITGKGMTHREFSASFLPELSKLSLFLSPPLGSLLEPQFPSADEEAELRASEGLFCSMTYFSFIAEKMMG